MTALDYAAIDISAHPASETDFVAGMLQPVGTATIEPYVGSTATPAPEEPSSLALMLIGVATLAAYRGIMQRLMRRPAAKAHAQPLIKPRRAA